MRRFRYGSVRARRTAAVGVAVAVLQMGLVVVCFLGFCWLIVVVSGGVSVVGCLFVVVGILGTVGCRLCLLIVGSSVVGYSSCCFAKGGSLLLQLLVVVGVVVGSVVDGVVG